MTALVRRDPFAGLHREPCLVGSPLKHVSSERHLRVLGAEAPRLHGLTPTLMFLDELQAIAHDDIYLALATALHKHPDSKLVITTPPPAAPTRLWGGFEPAPWPVR